MRAVGASERDPLSRLLAGTAGALRARRQLPARDARRASSRWLQPSWPDAFLLGVHRGRLVDALMRDEALRREVRDGLRLPVITAPGGGLTGQGSGDRTPADISELLAAAIAAADDPVTVLESAATDPDPMVAGAAAPYLKGELSLPVAEPRPTGPAGHPATGAADQDQKLRRRAREAEDAAKSLRRQLRDQQEETGELRRQLVDATGRAERAEAATVSLRSQVPSRREREALTSASSQYDKAGELKRSLDRERAARRAESRQLRELASEAETALGHAQEKLDAEARGRHRLEADLGDDAGRRAGRLVMLAVREAAELCQRAEGMPDGRDKTRQLRRARSLNELVASLRDLYGLDAAGEPGAQASTNGEAGGPQRALIAQVRSRGLTVTPVGGANHIGGSALLVEAGDTRILVDAGIKPQAHISRPGPDHIEEAVRERVDAVVITHAHADHAGFVPWVVERQRHTQVICSPQTKALLPVVWADSVRVMRADADAASSRADHVEPPYGEAEIEQAEGRLVAAGPGQTAIVRDLELTLFPAGHILGAAGVVIRAGDQRVVVTGDIDDRGQASVGPAQIPLGLTRGADLLVIETTYCDSIHRDRGQEGDDLVRQAGEVLDAGGRILIPAFGLGRAQEVALLLGERLPGVDVLVDGLASTISDLYARNGAPEVLRGHVRKVEHRSREIAGFREGVIITTSGMLTGGAAIPWAQAVLPEPDSALFLCGHQDEESPGRDLQELADADPGRPRRICLRDDQGRPVTVEVAAPVHTYNLSAHADRTGLKSIVDQVRPQAVMLVHGEPGPQALFRARLNAASYAVADNRSAWDADAVIADTRLARTRHAARGRGRRGRLS
ncbi:MAG TPA: MBL fold metallo-hydrolase [Trebonia sp.]|jgi:Cft2 family RNA processing exonuclease|nr:MBL fold metallo-hydrolase [Trebonia sp.]